MMECKIIISSQVRRMFVERDDVTIKSGICLMSCQSSASSVTINTVECLVLAFLPLTFSRSGDSDLL